MHLCVRGRRQRHRWQRLEQRDALLRVTFQFKRGELMSTELCPRIILNCEQFFSNDEL